MASRHQALTATPTALAGLTTGKRYTLQNRSPAPVYVAEASAVPGNARSAFALDPGFERIVEQASGEQIYIWATVSGGLNFGFVVYAEAP